MPTSQPLNIAIAGCGQRCRMLIDLIITGKLDWLQTRLVGILCPDPADTCGQAAQALGIFQTTDFRELYRLPRLDLIILLSDQKAFVDDIRRTKPASVQLIDPTTAGIFWDFFQRAEQWHSDLANTKQTLFKKEQKFRSLVENSLTGIYINQDGRIVFANNRFADIYGYPIEEIIGIDFLKLVHPNDRALVNEIHKKRLEGDETLSEYESRGLTKDGKVVWINRRNTRFVYEGKPAVLGNIVDITQQKQMAKKMMQMEKLASLGTFTSGIAHELNNPLNNILNSLHIVLEEWEDGDPEFTKTLLRDIEKQVERGKNIIKSLLDFSRTDRLNIRPVRFYRLVDQSLNLIKHNIPDNIKVHIDIPEDIEINISFEHIQQALINLLTNAAQAMGNNGGILQIKAFLDEKADEFCFLVKDTGKGIPAEHLKKIFDPFFTTKEPSQGTGLGLSITHGIIQQHGGRLAVSSQPGKGTTMTVHLPRLI